MPFILHWILLCYLFIVTVKFLYINETTVGKCRQKLASELYVQPVWFVESWRSAQSALIVFPIDDQASRSSLVLNVASLMTTSGQSVRQAGRLLATCLILSVSNHVAYYTLDQLQSPTAHSSSRSSLTIVCIHSYILRETVRRFCFTWLN
jgi:hypothetical protein